MTIRKSTAKITPKGARMDKKELLENAVLTGTPQEVAEILKNRYKGMNVYGELAFACRFRGIEFVKAFVESGVTMPNVWRRYGSYYWLSLLNISADLTPAKLTHRARCQVSDKTSMIKDKKTGEEKSFKMISEKRRVEIIRYLMQNVNIDCFDPGELLFYSIMGGDKNMTAALREMGVTFSEKRITALTGGRKVFERTEFLRLFNDILYDGKSSDFTEILRNIVKEIGEKKLRFSKELFFWNFDSDPRIYWIKYFDPEIFGLIMEHFGQEHMDKKRIMKCAVIVNSAESLDICAKYGWLAKPSDRDEMIEWASQEKSTECLAFLLDYKNRSFDLAAEREKAERIAQRKLNAAPGSVTALRALFRWKKQEDGTLIITNYIGSSTVIKVPSKIGRSVVTAIDCFAFSARYTLKRFNIYPDDPRFEAMCNISRITLPDSIRIINEYAFYDCCKLKEINIPDSVTYIGRKAFTDCAALTEIIIPDSVREMGESVFYGCSSLQTVKLSESVDRITAKMFRECSALRRITLPGSIRRIEDSAFARCKSLEETVIPASVTEIGKDIFLYAKKVTAVVEPNSYAEEYCKQNNIPFRYKEADSCSFGE